MMHSLTSGVCPGFQAPPALLVRGCVARNLLYHPQEPSPETPNMMGMGVGGEMFLSERSPTARETLFPAGVGVPIASGSWSCLLPPETLNCF